MEKGMYLLKAETIVSVDECQLVLMLYGLQYKNFTTKNMPEVTSKDPQSECVYYRLWLQGV